MTTKRAIVRRALSCARSLPMWSMPLGASLLSAVFSGGPARAACESVPRYLQIEALGPIELIETVHDVTAVDSMFPYYLIELPVGADEDRVLEGLELDPLVAWAERTLSTDLPEGIRQQMVAAVGGTVTQYRDQSFVDRVRLPEAHLHTLGENIRVGILDTGMRADHPAFQGRASGGYDFIDEDTDPGETSNGMDSDEDGNVDEGAGHGTMVAGVVHRVAPGAELRAYRVLDDDGRGNTFDVAKAIRAATDDNCEVVNLSLGLRCESRLISIEIDRASALGVVVVSAAGNDSTNEIQYYPASDPAVLAVAALDSSDVKADFSNYGEWVDLSAPGVGLFGPFHDGGWAYGSGTSFAGPFVAGQAALVRALHPGLPAAWVKSICRDGSVDVDALPGNVPYAGQLGDGRVDFAKTVALVPVAASTPEPVPQTIFVSPNPSTRGAAITLVLPPRQGARSEPLRVIDASGRLVLRLPSPAVGLARWNGRGRDGELVPAGAYFVQFGATRATITILDR